MELMIVLGIMAVTGMFLLPGIVDWISDSRLDAAARDFVSNCQLAKMQAARRNARCTITFNLTVGSETYDYVIYVDTDRDREFDTGEEILGQVKFSSEYGEVVFDTSKGGGDGVTFSNNGNDRPSVSFKSRGMPTGAGSVYVKNKIDKTKRVVVNRVGRIRIE